MPKDKLVAIAIAQADDPAIRAIVEDVCRATKMGFAALARVTDSRWIACQVVDQIEFGLDPGDELDVATTICNEIRESGQAVVIDHVTIDAGWRTHPTPTLYGFESYVSFPVVLSDGSFWGTLCAIDPNPHEVSSEDLVTLIGDYAARVARIIEGRVIERGIVA